MNRLPRSIEIFEVGPRDGLQNEPQILNLETKQTYIKKLIDAGFRNIEVGSFVREDRIPQMANSDELFEKILAREDSKNLTFWAPVPNERGFERAKKAGCRAIAVFTGATNTFTEKNIGMSIQQSLKAFEPLAKQALKSKMRIRGYVSVCWGCPYEGKVKPRQVIRLVRQLLEMGVEQVSLGDTIGVTNPLAVADLLDELRSEIKRNEIAGHFHDTRGTALANCLAALLTGVRTLDASSSGLGGCNYAPGAAGNVASEDLAYMLEGMGIKTGIDLNKLCEASHFVNRALGRSPSSRFLQAWISKKARARSTSSRK